MILIHCIAGIVDQMVWFRENWYEEVLRQLRQGLAKCYVIAFDNRQGVQDATITPHTLNFMKKLVSTFGIGIENISGSGGGSSGSGGSSGGSSGSAASESLVRRAAGAAQDPVFQKMKSEFGSNFDFTAPGANKLQVRIELFVDLLVTFGDNILTGHILAESDPEAEEVDQDPGGQDEVAAQIVPHRGEMPLPEQLQPPDSRGRVARGAAPPEAFTLPGMEKLDDWDPSNRPATRQCLIQGLIEFICCLPGKTDLLENGNMGSS